MISHEEFINFARAEGEALVDAAEGTDLSLQVPSCPDWNLQELIHHVGVVHRDKTNQLRSRSLERARVDIADPDPDELLTWYREGLKDLIAELERADADTAVWTWDGTNKAGFWSRRMAHENAVHRWDAQSVDGRPDPIDESLAIDGIDEYLFVHMPPPEELEEDERYRGSEGTVGLELADGSRAWTITLERPAPRAAEGRADNADVFVVAEPSDLLLFLWRRIPPAAVRFEGDPSTMESLQSWLAFVGT